MPLFPESQTTPPADEVLAIGFQNEANSEFNETVEKAYDMVVRFWFRNKDAGGAPSPVASATDPQPTGPEILIKMGTAAKSSLDMAGLRVQFLLDVQTLSGQSALVDITKLTPSSTDGIATKKWPTFGLKRITKNSTSLKI